MILDRPAWENVGEDDAQQADSMTFPFVYLSPADGEEVQEISRSKAAAFDGLSVASVPFPRFDAPASRGL